MPDVFLTGGTGFIGGALLKRLVGGGRRVRALVRNAGDADRMRAGGASPVRGDVRDLDSLRGGMEGSGVVYHAAGMNAFCVRDPSEMMRTNVDGSVNVIRAAADVGIEKVVYTSSAAAIGEAVGTVGTEESPHRGTYLTWYERSKHEAEVAVLSESGSLGVEVVALCPSSVQGPGRIGGTARILIGYLTGRLRLAVDSTLSIVFVDDCVEGHLLAEMRGIPGERYVLNGAVLTVREAVAALGEISGMVHRVRYLPAWAIRAGGVTAGGLFRLLGRDPAPFCGEMARALLHGHTYDGAKAARELGLRYTDVRRALEQTVAWLRAEGHV